MKNELETDETKDTNKKNTHWKHKRQREGERHILNNPGGRSGTGETNPDDHKGAKTRES